MLWHWQQLVQVLWLLSRSSEQVELTLPLTQSQAAQQRLNLGLPLLLPPPLDLREPEPATAPQVEVEPEIAVETLPEDPNTEEQTAEPSEAPTDAPEDAAPEPGSAVVVVDAAVAVEPEQTTEQHEGADLDAEIAEGDELPGGSPQGHGGQADGPGGGEGEP
jgi:hypothetical protein